jgi:heptosyltransferase-2
LTGRQADKNITLRNSKAILVVRLDAIGDAILNTPFLRELRRSAPQAWITLVARPQVFNLLEKCPHVNEVIAFDLRGAGLGRHARAFRLAAIRLWRRRFDMAIIPRWGADHYRATYLAYFSGAPRRVGYSESVRDTKQRINAGFDRMLTDVLTDRSPKHQVEYNLDVLRFLGGEVADARLEVWLDEEDRSFADKLFSTRGIGQNDLVVAIVPGARLPRKQWPVERFIEVGRLLLREYGPKLVIVGGPGERQLGERFEAELGESVISVAGDTTLRQAAAVLERCRLTVSNDTGAMHLAAAAGNSVVEISWHATEGEPGQPESPGCFRPWGVPHVVVQPEHARPPCRDGCKLKEPHCILGVSVERVFDAVRFLLPGEAPVG